MRDVLGNAVHTDDTVDAVRWLTMSEWQVLCNGRPLQPTWNVTTLVCIAHVDANRATLTLDDLRTQADPSVEAFDARYWSQRWTDVAALRLRERSGGRHRYGHVRVSELLLELAWFAHADNDYVVVRTAMNRLAQAMQGLAPHDRAYFI